MPRISSWLTKFPFESMTSATSVPFRLRISTLMALKRYDDVLGSCDAYLAREEPTVEILEIRGLARVARENYAGAIADFTRAIEMRSDPGPETKSRLLNRRGWAYHFADATRLALIDFEASLGLVKDQSDAFAGREHVLAAYKHGVEAGYRFYSYGDCMLVR